LAATLEVMGSHPSFGDISEIDFLESIQSPAQRDFKWSVWHSGNSLWPVMSAVISAKKSSCYQVATAYSKYQTKRTHTRVHRRHVYWLVSHVTQERVGYTLTFCCHHCHVLSKWPHVTITGKWPVKFCRLLLYRSSISSDVVSRGFVPYIVNHPLSSWAAVHPSPSLSLSLSLSVSLC